MEIVKNLTLLRLFKYILAVLLGTIILAISSKIKIPFYPVPMTMQTFVVLLIGIGYGWKLGLKHSPPGDQVAPDWLRGGSSCLCVRHPFDL